MHLCLSWFEINHCLSLSKTHTRLCDSLEPFQGSFDRDGSSTSGHPFDAERYSFNS